MNVHISPVSSDSSDEEIEETEEIKNAYIPYLYAKKSITKVIKDMKKMKSNHICIVTDIQREYKSIEDETQVCLFIHISHTCTFIDKLEYLTT